MRLKAMTLILPLKHPAVKNNAAGDIGISFCLGQYYDAEGKLQEAITYTKTPIFQFQVADPEHKITSTSLGGHDAINPAEYLNVWVCILDEGGGYAGYPGGKQTWDGIVIDVRNFGLTADPIAGKGKVLVHEIGHYFWLYHTWSDRDKEDCGNDFIDDTPPAALPPVDPVTIQDYPFRVGLCSEEAYGEMFCNYMTYNDDTYLTMFTKGQKEVIQAMLAPGGPRESLLYSKACLEPYRITLATSNCCPKIDQAQVVYTATTTSSVKLNWPHYEAAHGGYQVRHRAIWDNQWSAPTTVTKNEYQFDGLQKNKAYFFQIRATCTAGAYGTWTSLSENTMGNCQDLPSVATIAHVTGTSVTLNWASHASTDYQEVNISELLNDGTIYAPMKGTRINTNTYTFNDLKPGTSYKISVAWRCIVAPIDGAGSYRFWSRNVWTDGCQAPTQLYNIETTDKTIKITYDIKNIDHLTYNGAYRLFDGVDWSNEVAGNFEGIAYTGLAPNTQYVVRFRAECTDGSQTSYFRASAKTKPAAIGEANVLIYPNPANSTTPITIEQTAAVGAAYTHVAVLNSNGEVISAQRLQGQQTVKLVLGRLSPGLYLIVLRNGSETTTRRLLITR